MNKTSRSYQEELLKSLTDPAEAAAYLNAALDDGSDEIFLLALENVALARKRGSILEKGEDAEPANFMRPVSQGLRLSDLSEIFAGLGIRFVAQ